MVIMIVIWYYLWSSKETSSKTGVLSTMISTFLSQLNFIKMKEHNTVVKYIPICAQI